MIHAMIRGCRTPDRCDVAADVADDVAADVARDVVADVAGDVVADVADDVVADVNDDAVADASDDDGVLDDVEEDDVGTPPGSEGGDVSDSVDGVDCALSCCVVV